MTNRTVELLSCIGACGALLVATWACKGNKDNTASADDASATTATTAAATDDTVADAAPSASATATAKPKPVAAKCHGLMINKRCANECTSDDQCVDPKERCAIFSGNDDDGQNVMGAMVCQYDKDNEPRKKAGAGAATGDIVAAISGGDSVRAPDGRMMATDSCPSGYVGPADDHKCHKTCAKDSDCQSGSCGKVMSISACVAGAGATTATNVNTGQTVGVAAPKGGDCPAGWAPSVSEANKCDKECTSDAQCGPGNKCKAVGPIGSGKQCQKG